MFNSETSFGQHQMKLDHQGNLGGAYSENTRWIYKGVVFVGLNVPGSNNNKVNDGACLSAKSNRTQADCDADNLEYAERNAANLAWCSPGACKSGPVPGSRRRPDGGDPGRPRL